MRRGALLDLVMTNSEGLVEDVKVMEPLVLDVISSKGRKRRLSGLVSMDSSRGNHA